MDIKCPICGGILIIEDDIDNLTRYKIYPNGLIEKLSERDNSHGTVWCTISKNHELPEELISEVLNEFVLFKLKAKERGE